VIWEAVDVPNLGQDAGGKDWTQTLYGSQGVRQSGEELLDRACESVDLALDGPNQSQVCGQFQVDRV
jgi:hypothetical protein